MMRKKSKHTLNGGFPVTTKTRLELKFVDFSIVLNMMMMKAVGLSDKSMREKSRFLEFLNTVNIFIYLFQ